MNMKATLTAERRTSVGSHACTKLRAAGIVPAVVYGAGEKAQPITLQGVEFEKVWRTAGESTTVQLIGLGKELTVLINDVSVDPIYGIPTHADLLAVRTDQTVEVSVPLVFVGVAPAEKELGGTLIKVMHEIDVEALPQDLPHEIEVDVSALVTFEDVLHVMDLVLPKGVAAVTDGAEAVALVQEAVVVEEEAPAADVDLTEIAIEKKGKEEVEETA
jgi:large subunit ribosomal protein L25